MVARRLFLYLMTGAAALTAGCSFNGSIVRDELLQQSGGVAYELTDTPFYSQTTDQCGPSALATVLNAAGVLVTPDKLAPSVYIPDRNGSLQIELLAATRSYGRVPYPVEPDLLALLGEIQAGRPVLVLQNLGLGFAPVWHYAVVVGYLPDENRFVLRSGEQRRHLVKTSRFLRTWRRAESWGIVVLPPGTLPAGNDAASFVQAVASLESVGQFEAAAAAYQAAVAQWPEHTLAWLGLGNSYYALGQLGNAEAAYFKLLHFEPDNVIVLNNLSMVLADNGRIDDAIQIIDRALSLAEHSGATHELVSRTRAELQRLQISDQ